MTPVKVLLNCPLARLISPLTVDCFHLEKSGTLVSQNGEIVAILLSQASPVEVELFLVFFFYRYFLLFYLILICLAVNRVREKAL